LYTFCNFILFSIFFYKTSLIYEERKKKKKNLFPHLMYKLNNIET
jgi:hypothetical protein